MVTELMEQQEAASREGPRAMKEPGTVLWCWQTISALQSMWKSLNLDYDRYMEIWTEAEEYAIWEKIPPDKPFGTKETMLKALAVGDDTAARARVAEHAIPARLLPKRGGSSSADYLSARIARDRPDIWERMRNGEFKSVAEAARAAGIHRPRPKTVSLSTDIDRVAAGIKRHYSPEQIKALKDAL